MNIQIHMRRIEKKNNERFFPWITILEEGEIEMQEDHSVLS